MPAINNSIPMFPMVIPTITPADKLEDGGVVVGRGVIEVDSVPDG